RSPSAHVRGVPPHRYAARGSNAPNRLRLLIPNSRWRSVQMLADQLDYVIGVDPHRDTHALAVEVRTSAVAGGDRREPAGYRRALDRRAGHHMRQTGASSATSLATSTGSLNTRRRRLDIHRSVAGAQTTVLRPTAPAYHDDRAE